MLLLGKSRESGVEGGCRPVIPGPGQTEPGPSKGAGAGYGWRASGLAVGSRRFANSFLLPLLLRALPGGLVAWISP